MPTLMEATWDKWFEEHDAEVHARGREQGREQGLAEGTMRTLRRQAVARFGARTADRLSTLLRSVDADHLDEVGDWMLSCETADELLARVWALGSGGVRRTP